MMTWAREKHESAAILVLIPGEKEMDKLIREWNIYSKKHNLEVDVFTVDSTTPKKNARSTASILKTRTLHSTCEAQSW